MERLAFQRATEYKYFKIAFNWKATNWKKKVYQMNSHSHPPPPRYTQCIFSSTVNVQFIFQTMYVNCKMWFEFSFNQKFNIIQQTHNEIRLESSEEITVHANNFHVCTMRSTCFRISSKRGMCVFVVLKFNVFAQCSTDAADDDDADDVVGAC